MKKIVRFSIILVILVGLIPGILALPAAASSDLDWQWASPYPTGSGLYSILYAGGSFLVAGEDGTILTSSNGTDWTLQDSGTSNHLYGTAYIGGTYWVVGYGSILTSPDGVTWTDPNTGSGFNGRSIAYNGSRYVVPSSSHVRYSDDGGVTWNIQNLGFTDPSYRMLYDIVWDGSRFVAVGDAGTVITSPDGTTWTEQTTPITSTLRGLVWTGSLYVAVGNDGGVITSPDAVNWTEQTSGSTSQFLDIAWSGGQFVIVGNPLSAGEHICVYTSPDAVNWTKRDGDFRASFSGVAYDGTGMYIAVGFNGAIATSPDAVTWEKTSTGPTWDLNDVAWDGSMYLAVGNFGTIVIGQDGFNWTDVSPPFSTYSPLTLTPDLFSITAGNGKYVAVGGYGVILTSSDGVNWVKTYSSLAIGNLREVVWAGDPLNVFVVAGSMGDVLTSPDGITWISHAISGLSANQGVISMAWNGTNLVIGGRGLSVSDRFTGVSADGVNWTISPFGYDLNDIIWDGSQFLGVSGGIYIFTSPDGAVWTDVGASASSSLLFAVVWDGSQYTAVGRVSVHSSDASSWMQQTLMTSKELYGIAWNGHAQHVTVGQQGTILVAGPAYVPVDNPPVADAGGPYTTNEGQTVSLNGSASSDPDAGDTLTYDWDLDGDGIFDDASGVTTNATWPDNGIYPVSLMVTDEAGATDNTSATVIVLNIAPTLAALPDVLVDMEETFNLYENFSDPGVNDTHTAVINWGDGTIEPGSVNETGGSGMVTGSHAYDSTGSYSVSVTVTDKDGDSNTKGFTVDVAAVPGLVLEALGEEVSSADMPKGTANSLAASLSAAQNLLNDGDPANDHAAVNVLNAFINKVHAQAGKKIPADLAADLIARAQELIALLNS